MVASQAIGEIFCLYLWRSVDSPGTLYLARGIHHTRSVCAELLAAGYIVKIVEMATNVEYEMRDGALLVCANRKPAKRVDSHRRPPPRHAGILSTPRV
jgi:hypothetical protein